MCHGDGVRPAVTARRIRTHRTPRPQLGPLRLHPIPGRLVTADPINMSLFDVENVETMPKVRDMTVGPVSNADVREFSRRYHYTGLPGTVFARWGLWHGAVLHGVVAYNNGARGMGGAVLGDDYAIHVWHMGRLVLSEDSPRNSESRLIAGSLAALERDHKSVWAVVTYADEEMGHIGTVYQATNAYYTGTVPINSLPYFISNDGERRSWHGMTSSGKFSRHNLPAGWSAVMPQKPKHRYVYILGSKTQRRQRRALLKLPVLPYPKAAGS